MRIVDKNNSVDEVVSLILQKARYQKVVVCVDEKSDMAFVDDVCKKVGSNAVIIKYFYNHTNIEMFFNMINNGVRIVIYNVELKHFYALQSNSNYIINIFVPQSAFVLPYITSGDSVYGDNLLVCNIAQRDNLSLILLYALALDKLWSLLVQDVKVDTIMFKNIDAIANGRCDFYPELVNQVKFLTPVLNSNYHEVDESQLPYYIYLKISAILKMLESISCGTEQYIDFYKEGLSRDEISKAHTMLLGCNIVDVIKCHGNGLIKVTSAVLSRIKILIKKYFNFKNIKLNKLNKLIKNHAKRLNIDNLLYISYIFNSI